jgi:hypothetical protein
MKPGPKPVNGIAMSHAERQASYRARLAAAGKVVTAVDASLVGPGGYRDTLDRLHDALMKLERREAEVARLTGRVAYLEGELKQQERHNTNSLKQIVELKQELAKQR